MEKYGHCCGTHWCILLRIGTVEEKSASLAAPLGSCLFTLQRECIFVETRRIIRRRAQFNDFRIDRPGKKFQLSIEKKLGRFHNQYGQRAS